MDALPGGVLFLFLETLCWRGFSFWKTFYLLARRKVLINSNDCVLNWKLINKMYFLY